MPRTSDDILVFEDYGPGYRKELVEQHNSRTASKNVGFLLRHLENPSTIVDCGCGRGSITIGIAEAFPRAKILGCDISKELIEKARRDSERAGVTNVDFIQASVYDLPLGDGACDVVLAHAVLQHLARPDLAVSQMMRILAPGGRIALRDDDRGSMILAPTTDDMMEALEVMDWFLEHSSGDPFSGRHHRERLVAAGFEDVICSASCEFDGDAESVRARGNLAAEAFRGKLGARAVEAGRITPKRREELAAACAAWALDPAAFDSITWCEAVGRKPAIAL